MKKLVVLCSLVAFSFCVNSWSGDKAKVIPGKALEKLSVKFDKTGKILSLGERKHLYNFKRGEVKKGDEVKSVRLFSCPKERSQYCPKDGLAVKETQFYKNGKVYRMDIDQYQLKQKGTFFIEKGKMNFTYEKDGDVDTDDEKVDGVVLVADKIGDYLKKNWDKILKGDTLPVRWPVHDRLETVGFKFFKTKEIKKDGKEIVVVRMKPTSFIIAAIVDPLHFYHDKETAKLLWVDGRAIPKEMKDGKWKDLDAIFEIYDIK